MRTGWWEGRGSLWRYTEDLVSPSVSQSYCYLLLPAPSARTPPPFPCFYDSTSQFPLFLIFGVVLNFPAYSWQVGLTRSRRQAGPEGERGLEEFLPSSSFFICLLVLVSSRSGLSLVTTTAPQPSPSIRDSILHGGSQGSLARYERGCCSGVIDGCACSESYAPVAVRGEIEAAEMRACIDEAGGGGERELYKWAFC